MNFSGSEPVPLVLGSLRGLRVWNPTGGGSLTGVVYPFIWGATENKAVCGNGLTMFNAGHHIASLDCSCGFYSYYTGAEVSHADSYKVLGIIEGYGRTTFGALGFRCEKAKIVALYNPYANKKGEKKSIEEVELERFIPKKLTFSRFLGIHLWKIKWELFFALLYLFTFIFRIVIYDNLWLNLTMWVFLGFWWGFIIKRFLYQRRQRKLQVASVLNTLSAGFFPGTRNERLSARQCANVLVNTYRVSSHIEKRYFKRIHERYPNVPMFDDIEEMIKAFPPSSPRQLENF